MAKSSFRFCPRSGRCWRRLTFLGFRDYRVSFDGVVQSRKVYGSKMGRKGPWWTMKAKGRDRCEHVWVDLFRVTGKPERFSIHQLVALAFLGPGPEGTFVCHRDDRPKNNDVVNLYWGTKKSNMDDAVRNGKYPASEDIYNASATNEEVRKIRRMRESGMRLKEISRVMGINEKNVGRITRRETYKLVV